MCEERAELRQTKERVVLYHTGFDVIESPDIHYGRKNADFGQGFYLSADADFSERWARQRKGISTYINTYELVTAGLRVKHFSRDGEWFDYIYKNRNGYEDALKEYDVIIGPIANDTIYDTWGVITSGFLSREQALALLTIGPLYEQVVIKTEKAASGLLWRSACVIDSADIARFRETVEKEEREFQELFSDALDRIINKEERPIV